MSCLQIKSSLLIHCMSDIKKYMAGVQISFSICFYDINAFEFFFLN